MEKHELPPVLYAVRQAQLIVQKKARDELKARRAEVKPLSAKQREMKLILRDGVWRLAFPW